MTPCYDQDEMKDGSSEKRSGETMGTPRIHNVLSLFSGCGGMDLGFEGQFLANRKSFVPGSGYIDHAVDQDWVMLKKNNFTTVFANDILPEAEIAWTTYMTRFGHSPEIYHNTSIVDLVKEHLAGADVFPKDIDVVTGGFPCQDFSVGENAMVSTPRKTIWGNVA